MNPESAHQSLPDPAKCRTHLYGIGLMAQCLVDSPDACKYATRVRALVFCNNPDRLKIVARSWPKQTKKNP
ncbi:MAG: hypothetical protein HZC54_21275 [Verrucomicrobia bacterium]|nr:hypothetical protein [Verrucomicrobiota bacterium]